MRNLVEFLYQRGFQEKGRPEGADYVVLNKGRLNLSVASHQSEISINLFRKSGYVLPVVELMASQEMFATSVAIVHEDWHVLDGGDRYAINEHQLIDALSKNWPKVEQLLLSTYFTG